MPRPADPITRLALIDAATFILAQGYEVTLRAVAQQAGTSTMGVYTHFDGMPGLLFAVRERAFDRLAERLVQDRPTADTVADLVVAGRTYVDFAVNERGLYPIMFDIVRDARQPAAASMTFAVLVAAVERAQADGRLDPKLDAGVAATRLWAMTHGVLTLVLAQALPGSACDDHLPAMYEAQLVAWGDGPRKAPTSVRAGWART